MLVSVIIPVYNVQDYLARCIDSVVTQTYHELQILLVDDGSTDSSGSICDDYAKKDQRITVIHKKNGGLSDARNAGLDAMNGNYVTFIDADDYVHPQFVELLLNTIINTGAQIAVCHWKQLKESDTTPISCGDKACRYEKNEPITIFYREQALRSIFYQKELTHSACSRLFDSSIFSDICFPRGVLYEDLAVIYPIMRKVNTVALIGPEMYFYMHHPGSITSTLSLQRTQVLDILDDIEQQVATEEPHLLPAVQSRHMSACFNMLRIMPLNDPAWDATREKCIDYTKKMRKLCLFDKNVRIINKIAIILSYLGVKPLLFVINRNSNNPE